MRFLRLLVVFFSAELAHGQTSATRNSAFDLSDAFPPDGTRDFTVSATRGALAAGSEVTSVNVAVGYMRHQGGAWVLGFEGALGNTSYKGGSAKSLSIMGITHYLLPPADFKSSVFVLGGLGLANAGARIGGVNNDETAVGLRIGAGRRFKLLRDLYLRPEIYIEKVGDLDPGLVFEFLKLSLIF